MKIAVSSNGTTLEAMVDARFGRCLYYLCIDSDTLAVDAIPNPNASLAGGAGPQSASLMADKGVSVVLTGNCGPNAFQAFGAAGIQVITGVSGRVRDVVEEYKTGRLTQSSTPSVQSHYGSGNVAPGGGRGKGGGGGRGMGGGGGKGMGGGGRGLKGA